MSTQVTCSVFRQFVLLIAFACMALFSACGDSGSTDTPVDGDVTDQDIMGDAEPDTDENGDAEPELEDGDDETCVSPLVCPTEVDFGNVILSQQACRDISIANTGDTSITITKVEVFGDAEEFTVLDGPCGTGNPLDAVRFSDIAIAPGESTMFGVRYIPADPGPDEVQLVVTTRDDPCGDNSHSITLISRCKGECQLTATPGLVDFGNLAADVEPQPQTVVLANECLSADDNVTLQIGGLNQEGSPKFTLNNCMSSDIPVQLLGLLLPPGEDVTCEVGFQGAMRSNVFAGSFTISTTPQQCQESRSTTVQTHAVVDSPMPVFMPSNNVVSFCYSGVGTTPPETRSLILKNNGTVAFTLQSVAVDPANAPFYITSRTTEDITLEPDEELTFGIAFEPQYESAFAASLLFTFDFRSAPYAVTLLGRSVEVCPDGFVSEGCDCIPSRCYPTDRIVCDPEDTDHRNRLTCNSTTGLYSVPATPCPENQVCVDGPPPFGSAECRACEFDGQIECFGNQPRICRNFQFEDLPSCNDAVACTQDLCDATEPTGCMHVPVDSLCDDTNDCTEDVCDPSSDAADKCVHTDKADDTVCDDGLFCIVNTTCQSGRCVGETRDCNAVPDYAGCKTQVCNEALGQCAETQTNLPNGTPCDDGDEGTTEDQCTDGLCTGTPPASCSPDDGICCISGQPANEGQICTDDGNDCTDDICSASGVCTHLAKDDGTVCGTEDQCFNGNCVDCTDVSGCDDLVDDGLECSEPVCNPEINTCEHDLTAHSGELCTNDSLTCTRDLCDDQGQCSHDTLEDNSCLIEASCYQAGEAQDVDYCVICDPAVNTTAWTNADGTECAVSDDNNPCTDNVCQQGTCAYVSNDANACQDDLDCTATACQGGSCVVSGVTAGCFIDGACVDEGVTQAATGDDSCRICNAATATDAWTVLENGESCDDGDGNSFGEVCTTGGVCLGCTPDCNGKECGDDGCGGSCGICQDGLYCDESGMCSNQCAPVDGWPYVKCVAIDNSSNENALSDYQVRVVFDHSFMVANGTSRLDAGDIRFTSNDGQTFLPYFSEPGTFNTVDATFWVKIPNLAANRTTLICMHYGNLTALSESSGDETFSFFENFSGVELNTDKWSVFGGTVNVTGGIAYLSGTWGDGFSTEGKVAISAPFIAEYRTKRQGDYENAIGFSIVGEETGNVDSFDSSHPICPGFRLMVGGIFGSEYLCNGTEFATTEYRAYKAELHDFLWHVSRGSTLTSLTEQLSVNLEKNVNPFNFFIKMGVLGPQTVEFDWIRVRKFTHNEPMVSVKECTDCHCNQKECGDDGCGNSCGECDEGFTCSANGQCVPPCVHPEVVENCSDGWCAIPAGCFWMGSPDGVNCPEGYPGDCIAEPGRNEDEVLHAVTLTQDFVAMQHEVTQSQWGTIAATEGWQQNPSYNANCDECPVEFVNWYEAAAYANALSQKNGLPQCYILESCTGVIGEGCLSTGCDGYECGFTANPAYASPYECPGYRLPTDAEWEYITRAGTLSAYYSGSNVYDGVDVCSEDTNLAQVGWYCYNDDDTTHPVGEKSSNGWGLHDTHGNVWEWVSDSTGYLLDISYEPVTDPFYFITDDILKRGGSWNAASHCARSSERGTNMRYHRREWAGFRLVKSCICGESQQCGDDGCGNSCGQCGQNEICGEDNQCQSTGITWVDIPEGAFQMGCSPNDSLCHSTEFPNKIIYISSFQMSQTEITQDQYELVMGYNPSWNSGCGNCPVDSVSKLDAKAFCENIGARLPSESEWEYGARAGTTTMLPCNGCSLPDIAWYGESFPDGNAHPVAQKSPNNFGLYDMIGNVHEFVEDCRDWNSGLGSIPIDGSPYIDENCPFSCNRGGSWASTSFQLRSSFREHIRHDEGHSVHGFRCARDTCIPNCENKECGPDGCGGLCGPGCSTGQTCNAQGLCEGEQNTYTLYNNVVLIPPSATVQDLGIEPCEQLRVDFVDDGTVPDVQAGDVVVIQTGDGLICEVTTVSSLKSKSIFSLIIGGIAKGLDSVFSDLNFSISFPIAPSIDIQRTLALSNELVSATIEPSTANLNGVFQMQLRRVNGNWEYFWAGFSGTSGTMIKSSIEGHAQVSTDYRKTIAEIPFTSFPIFFVPTIVHFGVDAVIKLEAARAVKFSSGVTRSSRYVLGTRWTPVNSWEMVYTRDTNQSTSPIYETEVLDDVALKTYLATFLDVRVASVAGPIIEIRPGLETKIEWSVIPPVLPELSFSGCIEAALGIHTKFLGWNEVFDLLSAETCVGIAAFSLVECNTGDCCDVINGLYLPFGTNCGNYSYRFVCNGGTGCDSDITKERQTQRCTGTSSTCSGNWSAWEYDSTIQCDASHNCVTGSSSCGVCEADQCISGVCCDTTTNPKVFKSSSEECQSDAMYEYGCPWGTDCGDNTAIHYKNRYCSGSSAGCDGVYSSSWSSWEIADDCASTEKCNPNGYCEPCQSCTSNYCQDNGYSSGSYCADYNTRVVCGVDGDCNVETNHIDCYGGFRYCISGNCVECRDHNDCSSGYSCSSYSCVPDTEEVCNGVDDDGDGVIDELESCWKPVYRFWNDEPSGYYTFANRCYSNSTTPPSSCSWFNLENSDPIFYLYAGDYWPGGTDIISQFWKQNSDPDSYHHVLTIKFSEEYNHLIDNTNYQYKGDLGYIARCGIYPTGNFYKPNNAVTNDVKEIQRWYCSGAIPGYYSHFFTTSSSDVPNNACWENTEPNFDGCYAWGSRL